jgi:hypothetical protein
MDEAPPDEELSARVARLLGAPAQSWRRVHGGYTPAARWLVSYGARTAFVKVATNKTTRRMLRDEAAIYACAQGPFMARFIAWEDHETAPVLIIEDLSRAAWPPPWSRERIEAVRAAIAAMHATPAPGAPRFADKLAPYMRGWSLVEEDPAPFLSLGLVSAAWLSQALPRLVAAERACETEGEALTHWDIRSDNVCIGAEGAKLIDWAAACRSNPKLDIGGWAPSLAFEGGPAPEDLLGAAPEVAAFISGYFAARAGLAAIPDAPRVRLVQKQQLSAALPWVLRALKLPAP